MVACSNPGSDQTSSQSGIIQGHAYTFLQATEVQLGSNKERIVQLRNPWGDVEFRGRWSDEDSTWNYVDTATMTKLGVNRNKADGVFFMPFEDFCLEFRDLYVAEINDKASYVYESFHDPES